MAAFGVEGVPGAETPPDVALFLSCGDEAETAGDTELRVLSTGLMGDAVLVDPSTEAAATEVFRGSVLLV